MGADTSTADLVAGHETSRRASAAAGTSEPTAALTERASAGTGADGSSGLGYVPALDGMRAVALAGVLLFHHGYDAAPAGFLGVSTFFTLSGFLITTLALHEWASHGRLSPARFYERRARRLLPAALLTFAGVIALRAFTDVGASRGFRTDVLAALGYVANWRFAATGDSYAALFAKPSPVLHYWSLAIEEQFYLAFPLVFAAALAVLTIGRRRRSTPGDARGLGELTLVLGCGLFGLAAAGSFAVAWLSAERNGNDGTTYYGTHTRAGELLAGVALAFLLRTAMARRLRRAPGATLALWITGPAALAGLLWIWHRAALDDARLFQGITLANAGLSCLLIAAALHRGPASGTLGLWPLRVLGKVSYAAYLFHWPLFLLLSPPRVDLGTHTLFVARVALTLAAATASYHLLEAPFRFRLRMPRLRLAATLATAASVVAALLATAPQHQTRTIDFTAAAANPAASPGGSPDEMADDNDIGEPDVAPQFPFLRQEGAVRPLDGGPPDARILLAGDSMSSSLLVGFEHWNETHPDEQLWVDTHSVFGCAMVATELTPIIGVWSTTPQCYDWHEDLSAALAKWDSDVVFFIMGLADIQGHEMGGHLVDLGTPAHDEWFLGEIEKLADVLTAPGIPLVWSSFPHIRMESQFDPTKGWDEFAINEPWRVDRLNEMVASVLDDHPGVHAVDMDAWIRSWAGGEFDPALRDGVHFLDKGSDLAGQWLVPQLLDAAEARRPT